MIGLIALLLIPVAAWAQVEITEKPQPSQTIEPGAEQEISTNRLGDGVIVFEFKVSDVDPLADDNWPASIECFVVQNLGSSTVLEVEEVAILRDGKPIDVQTDSYELATPSMPDDYDDLVLQAPDPSTGPSKSLDGKPYKNYCPEVGDGQYRWEAIFPSPLEGGSKDLFENTTPSPKFNDLPTVIQDDGSVSFQIAVRIAKSSTLGDEAQNHTIRPRVMIQYREKVGSPPETTTFTASITDSTADYVWNGGINSYREVEADPTQPVASSIRPGDTGVVGYFQICDEDAHSQTHSLRITGMEIRQGPQGNAVGNDVTEFILERKAVGSGTFSAVPGGTFTPLSSSGFKYRSGSLNEQLEDGDNSRDGAEKSCVRYRLIAKVSESAMRGRKIQTKIIFTGVEEPTGASIQGVMPSLELTKSIIIGSGILRIPDVGLPLRRSVDGSLQGKQTASLSLQVDSLQRPLLSQTGSVQFDPNLIQVVDIQPVTTKVNMIQTQPYDITSSTISNRRGTLSFSINLRESVRDSVQTPYENLKKGPIARILVQPTSQASVGQRSLLSLSVDGVQDVTGNEVTQSLLIQSGSITWETSGDIDGDGMATVRDALLLANAIINGCEDLSDDQLIAADVDGSAPLDEVPTCDEHLTSSDVSKIAELALDATGVESSQVQAGEGDADADGSSSSWLDGLKRLLGWDTDDPQQPTEFEIMPSGQGYTVQASTTDAIGGLQGRIRYDSDEVNVEKIKGLNEYEVIASRVNDRRGEIRFVALAPAGEGSRSQQVLEVVTSEASDRALSPRMSIDMLVDPQGDPLDHRVAAASSMRGLHVQALSLSKPETGRWTLHVQGQRIQRVEVQGFDLGGKRRFASSAQGSQLEWRALDEQTGRPLANGVYLYRVTVEGVHGEIWRSDVRKFVVLR